MRVGLFIPCLIDQLYPRVGENVVRILKRIGMAVHYAEEVVCCGQPFFKSGHWAETVPLAKTTIRAFRNDEVVVVPSGSCASMLRHGYGELFRDDQAWFERAQELSGKIYELSEFIIHVAQVDDFGASYEGKVVYHDSCQVVRGLGVSSEPRQLLRKVKGLELVEMERSDLCCGFGGLFSLKFPHVAKAMVMDKVEHIIASGAKVVVGCEISCLMHIGGYLGHEGMPVRTMHLADILAQGI